MMTKDLGDLREDLGDLREDFDDQREDLRDQREELKNNLMSQLGQSPQLLTEPRLKPSNSKVSA